MDKILRELLCRGCWQLEASPPALPKREGAEVMRQLIFILSLNLPPPSLWEGTGVGCYYFNIFLPLTMLIPFCILLKR